MCMIFHLAMRCKCKTKQSFEFGNCQNQILDYRCGISKIFTWKIAWIEFLENLLKFRILNSHTWRTPCISIFNLTMIVCWQFEKPSGKYEKPKKVSVSYLLLRVLLTFNIDLWLWYVATPSANIHLFLAGIFV